MPTRYVTINGIRQIDPRSTWAWRRLRDQVVREEPLCWLRLPDICTTLSTTGDHLVPVTVSPELALVRSNVRGACKACNDARGNTPVSALHLVERHDATPRATALDIFD